MVQSDRVGDTVTIRSPKRISMSLFDEELISLVNASAKIFPITQNDVDTNNNPSGYEYGRVDNSIYRWSGVWKYIVADDVDISYTDLKNIPASFNPISHNHTESNISDLDKYTKLEVDTKVGVKADKTELHSHSNKSILDTIIQSLIDKWNAAYTHITDVVKHITGAERTLWNSVSNKTDKTYVDTELGKKASSTHNHDTVYDTISSVNSKLSGKSDSVHNHDGAYYKKSEVDGKLISKSDTTHKHVEVDITDLDKYTKVETDNKLSAKANTSHSHTEADISNLNKYTKLEVDNKIATRAPIVHGHVELHTHNNKSILDKVVETEPKMSYDLSQLQYIEDIRAGYTEGHAHTNLSVLTSITSAIVDSWNSAVTHITDAVKHITSTERTLWNTVSSKEPIITKNTAFNKNFGTVVGTVTQGNDSRLSDSRTPLAHNHNDSYNTKSEINTLLSGKSDNSHTHTDKADKTYVDTELAKKANSTTLNGHTGNATVHVTQVDKDSWSGKAEISDIPDIYIHPSTHPYSMLTGVPTIPTSTSQLTNNSGFITIASIPSPTPHTTIGTVKPTDGSMWYKTI